MIERALVSALTQARLLPPDTTRWSEPHRWVAQAGQRLLALGLSPDTIVQLATLGWRVAETEVDAVVAEVGDGLPPEAALERQTRRRQAVTRLLSALRHDRVSQTMRHLMGLGAPFRDFALEPPHTPSPLFLAQHDLETTLQRLSGLADPAAAERRGRLLMALGRYPEAIERLAPLSTSPSALAHLALARTAQGDSAQALGDADWALEEAPNHPLVLALAATVRAHAAGQSDQDALLASQHAADALELLSRSRAAPAPADAWDQATLWLLRGRLGLLMPRALTGLHDAARTDLREVLRITRTPAPPEIPRGLAPILRLNAAWLLAQSLREETPLNARDLLFEVLVIDPACRLAERAYRQLSEIENG